MTSGREFSDGQKKQPLPKILEHSVFCKSFREASNAAKEVADVVEASIKSGYKTMKPRHSFADSLSNVAVNVWSVFSPLALGIVGCAAYNSGMGVLAGVLGLLAVPIWCGPALYAAEIIHREKKPTFQFATASRALGLVGDHFGEGRERWLVREFNKRATFAFKMGEISTLQECIRRGQGSLRELREMQDRGFVLIDGVARDLGWDVARHENLKAAFIEGRLPPPQDFLRVFIQQHHGLQTELSKVTGDTVSPWVTKNGGLAIEP